MFKKIALFLSVLFVLSACGGGGSNLTTLGVPVAIDGSVTTNEDTAKDITLNATDADGDTLTYSAVTNPSHGTISISQNTATYTPTANYNGTDNFTFKANDGTVDSNTAMVSITVNAVNDAPTANAGADVSVIEGNTTVLEGSGTDVDSGDTLSYSWSPATNLSDASIAQPIFTAPAVSANKELVYTLTVSDSVGTVATDNVSVSVSVLNLPEQVQNVQTEVFYEQLKLSWDAVSDATTYDICQATETITAPENCASHQDGKLITGVTSPQVITSLTNGTQYFFVVIPKNVKGDGPASEVVKATPRTILNDTGATLCGDYAYDGGSDNHNNNLNCNGTDLDGDPIPPGQDALYGRDATHNDDSDGHAGFSFTKISSTGAELPASATEWSCVKDNVTGLIWEVKTNDGGLHDKNKTYTWYNPDNSTNGGSAGTENGDNDTDSFVVNTNAIGLCGANDWRLPAREELRSLVDYGVVNPVIDTTYYPNTVSSSYWSSSPNAGNSNDAWIVHFSHGSDSAYNKINNNYIRLVRSGQ